MRQILATLTLVAFAVGCAHTQPNPNPTVFTCPTAGNNTYTPLNQATPATGPAYTDTHPATGNYCYVVVSYLASTNQTSLPSNVAGPFAVSGTNSVSLSWIAPTTGPTPSGYIMSRVAAVSSTIAPPLLGPGSLALDVKPAFPTVGPARTHYLAQLEALHLAGRVK